MATAEPVIPSALLEVREYDVFRCIRSAKGFVSNTDIAEPFRFKVDAIEGPGAPQHGKVEASLWAYGEQIGVTLTSSHAENGSLGEWLFFPIDIRDLPLDVCVCCDVYDVDGLVGGTTFYPFTSRGELKAGDRSYRIHPGRAADSSETSTTLGNVRSAEWDLLARDHAQDRMVKVPWLDHLATNKLMQLNQRRCDDLGILLRVDFPVTSNKLPIFHTSVPQGFDNAMEFEQRPSPFVPYPDLDAAGENLAETQAGILSKSLHLITDPDAQPALKERKQIMAVINRAPVQLEPIRVDDASLLWQFRYFLLKHPKGFVPFMECVDWSNANERKEGQKLMELWKQIPIEDTLILLSSQFKDVPVLRNYAIRVLKRQGNAKLHVLLLQLVQAIRYDSKEEELGTFIIDRAVKSWDLCCHVYWYASVEIDIEVSQDGAGEGAGGEKKPAPPTATNINSMEIDGEKLPGYSRTRWRLLVALQKENPLYLDRLQKQEELRTTLTTLYSALIKEKDRTKKIAMAKRLIDEQSCGIAETFSPSSPANATSASPLANSASGVDFANSVSDARPPAECVDVLLPSHPRISVDNIISDGVYLFKSAKMPIKVPFRVKGVLQEGTDNAPTSRGKDEELAVGEPKEDVDGIGSGDEREGSPAGDEGRRRSNTAAMTPVSSPDEESDPPGSIRGIMYKCGDDVRQDQLVIQFIELFDGLLKSNGLDLCLTPYKVLATSQADGFMELVKDVDTFQNVQKETVQKYVSKHNPTPEGYKKAMERFVKSCAGYCVITFLLGIGDRHLENLLITKDGRLLHIDFGFIFGYDPKPFPPPMKINKEMIDAIGGINSEQYRQFKTYCCSAYIIFRKHASLILQLLLLMVDASIPHITGDGSADPRMGVVKVQDKLRLDLNDAEATQHIQNVIADSVGALFTNLWDIIHEAAQAVRT